MPPPIPPLVGFGCRRFAVRRARLGVARAFAAQLTALAAVALAVAQSAPPAASTVPTSLKELSLEQLLEVKVVTATQVETDPFNLPFMLSAFTRQDYERTLPRSLPQWLDGSPGVMVQQTANGQFSPYLRGLTGFRTLFLIDGIRLNNSTFREGPNQYWTTVDALSVNRLEVVKGPASVLYGSDSIGGTVNALTIGPPDDGRSVTWHGRALYRFSTAEDSHTARLEGGGPLGEHARFYAGGTAKHFGDLRSGDGARQPHTGYTDNDFDAKLDYFYRPNLKLTAAHQSVMQDDVWRTHSTIYGSRWHGLVPGSDRERSASQQRALSYLQFHAKSLAGPVEDVQATLSFHYTDEDQVRLRSNLRRDLTDTNVDTFGAQVQLQSPTRFGHWVYGATFYRDWVGSANLRYNADGSFAGADVQGQVADDSRYDLLGAFVQNRVNVSRRVDLTVRGRYDLARARAGRVLDPITNLPTSFSGHWASFVGSARATFHASDHWQFFAGVSQGFRAPNLSDLSRLDAVLSGQIETPSTQVNPEYYVIDEAGFKARYDQWDIAAAVFNTQIQGMIIREPTGRIVRGLKEITKRNSGDGYLSGVELEGHLHFGSVWTGQGAFTWMDGRVTVFPSSDPGARTREPLSRLMPTTVRLALRCEPPRSAWWAELSATAAARQDRLSATDISDTERIPPGGTPGYTVCTLRGGWRVNRHLSLSAAVENLADRDYRVHGSGINAPGRNLILSGTTQF